MKRTREKLKLANSPLSLVLCQVRFQPLMLMGEYIPRVQDQLRLNGYPVNETRAVREVQFGPIGTGARERVYWEFMTKARRASVVVTEGFVVLQTTAYDDFETFLGQLRMVVSIVNTTVGGLLITRIGLRYVDAIVPNSGETWRQYVKPCLHGFESPLFIEEDVLRLHQTVARTSVGTMVVRLHQNREGAVLPPDLAGGALRAPGSKAEAETTVTLLDIDHFRDCDSIEFDEEQFEAVAWKLKEGAFSVFADQIVTEHALRAWT